MLNGLINYIKSNIEQPMLGRIQLLPKDELVIPIIYNGQAMSSISLDIPCSFLLVGETSIDNSKDEGFDEQTYTYPITLFVVFQRSAFYPEDVVLTINKAITCIDCNEITNYVENGRLSLEPTASNTDPVSVWNVLHQNVPFNLKESNWLISINYNVIYEFDLKCDEVCP